MTHITISHVASKYIVSLAVGQSLGAEAVVDTYDQAVEKALQFLKSPNSNPAGVR